MVSLKTDNSCRWKATKKTGCMDRPKTVYVAWKHEKDSPYELFKK